MSKKYQDFRTFSTRGNQVNFDLVKGQLVEVKNSPYLFFKEKGQNSLHNVETGIACGMLEYVESHIQYINHEIGQALTYFGNINEMPASGKVYPSWYWQFAHEYKEIFNHSMPVDICGLDVIKMDSFIRPLDGQSTRDAIADKYGQKAIDLINSILASPPYMFYFYNPLYIPFNE
jgi:hypothetical protein